MPVPEDTSAVDHDLDRLVEDFFGQRGLDPAGACVSVWCGTIRGNARYTRDAGAQHYAASTMKLPLLVAAYRRHERGELDLDAEVPVHNRFSSAADGSPYSLDQAQDQDDETWAALGASRTLRRLARHAVVRSGNLATNLLLERVGAGEVATVLADAGCTTDTALPRGIEDAVARESGLDNRVTAHGLALVMAGIADRTLALPETCAEVERILAEQQHREMIPAGLPPGTRVANKTGWVEGVAHDVALVRPDDADPYVLAVCTTAHLTEQQGQQLIARISAAMWARRQA